MVSINGLPSTSNEKDHSPSTSSASFRPKPVEPQKVNTDTRSPQSPSILKRAREPSSASESENTPPRVFPQLSFRSSIDNISTDEQRVTSRKMPGLDDDQALREVKVGDAPSQDTDHSSKPHMSESSVPSFPTKPTAALPRPKTVFEEIKAFGNKQTKKGQTWYLVADSWYRRLEKFAATDAIATSVAIDDYTQHELYPGPVDNSTIVEVDDLTLKRGMLEGYDFHFLSEEGWKKLVSWFGIQNAWTPISLPVIVPGRFSVPIIEIYPPTFTLLRIAKEKAEPSSTTREYPPQITISRGATISDLHTKAAQALSVLPKNFRIWRLRESTEDFEPLLGSKSAITNEEFQTSIITVNDLKEKYDGELVQEPDDLLVGEAPFVADMFIAMEIADDNGNWIIEWNNPNANADGESSSTKEPKGKPFTMNTIVHDTDDEDELTSSHFDRLDKWANNDDDVLALTPSTVSQSTSQDLSFTKVSHVISPAHRSIKPFQSMHTGSSLTTKIRENDSPKPTEVPKRKHPRGVTGLQNLGNTCFMNSALQCLSNTAKLTAYFMDGTYKKELNRTNPLGMNGEVAEVYGALVESLWSPTGSLSVNPREFKYTIARFAPFFTGYQQHDSQELLNFLLDGLHEDLNRIEKKPYIELKDSDGRPDDVVAKEVWEAHKARNDSVITDIFSGQFKSTLVCPECNIVSVTFDPFSTLSLPLPVAKKKKLDVIVVRTDINTRPLKLTLSLPKEATHRNMKEEIGKILTINPKKLASIETFGNKIYKIFDDKDAIAEIRDNDVIYVHELQATFPPKKTLKSTSAEPSNTSAEDYIVFNALSCYDSHSPSYFGVPMLVCVTIEESKNPELLYTRIVEQYQRYTTKKLFAPLEAVGRQAEHGLDDDITMHENAGHPAIRGLFNTKLYSTGYSANRNPLNVSLAEMAATKVFQARSINLAPLTHRAEKAAAEMKRAKLSVERDQKMQLEKEEDKQSAVPSTLDEIESSDVELPQLSTFLAPPASPRVESNDTMVEDDGDTQQEPLPQVPLVHMGDVVLCEWSRDHADYVFETKAPSKMAMVLSTRVKDAEVDEMETGTEESVEPEQNPLEARLGREKGKSLFDSMEEMISPATLAQQAEDERRRVKGTSLIDCFDEFMQTEKLSDDNLWYCRKCKEHRRASKSMGFWKLPEVLIVQLKRFSQSRTLRDKIDIMVDFDVEGLDLSSKVSGEKHEHDGGLIYDLHAVSNHYGGLGGGHYTAYAQNPEDGQWYHFDDSRVEKVSVDSIKTSAAYLLFYRRREIKNVPCGPVKMPVRAVEAESPTFSNRPTLRFSENRRPFENTPSYGRSIANDDDGIGNDVISTNPRTPTFPGDGRVLGFSSTVSREIPSVISASSFVPRSVMIPQSSLQSTTSPTSTSPSSPQSCTSSSSPGTPSSTICASRSETPGRFDQLMINQSPSSPWVAVPSGSNSSPSSFETRFNTELSDVVFRDSSTTLDFDVGDEHAEPNGRRDHREERMPENNDMDE